MLFHGLHHFIQAGANASRLHNKLLDFLTQQALPVTTASLWWISDNGATSGARYQPAFLDQMLYHLVGCVRVNFQVGGQAAH